MPKISRIRIINFSYNGDKRLILDEFFNLHQGEDALISLKNGGGKSVLVQALMQPILPNVMLQKRKMSDFFVKKKQPAYILVEWKLDGDGGYLLTGIAMMSKESTFQELEEGNHSVKYFTFTTSYRLKDSMDIRHIDLTTKDKNRVVVKSFVEAQKLIQDARKLHSGSVAYFSEYDKKAYQKHLESFNIHPDEWKTVLLPINSEEGGLIKIFEKCRTPRLLLRDWILSTVNKVIFEDVEESQSLTEMMGNLAQSMIDNESFILERDLLTGFSGRLKVLSDAVCSAAGTQSEKIEKEKELRSIEQFLHVELARLEEKMASSEEELEEKKKELYRIDQERVSEEFYIAEENYEKSRQKVEELKAELKASEEKLGNVKYDIQVMEARMVYEEILKLQSEVAGIETELLRLKEPSEDQEMMERVAYSLKIALEAKAQELFGKLEEMRDHLHGLQMRKEEGKKEEASIRHSEKENMRAMNEHLSFISAFEKEEKELTERFFVSIQRNLLKGLDTKAADALILSIRKEAEEAVRVLESMEQKRAQAVEEEEAVLEEVPKVEVRRKEYENELKKLESELSEFEKKEEAVLTCLNRYDISSSKRFQKEYLLSVFKELLETAQEKLDTAKEEIRSLDKRKSAMENGILHVSKEFFDHLMDLGIEFDTGENYLQKHSMEIRRNLLKSIPLLPYAFLMTEEELEKLKSNLPEHPMLQPVPVLTYGSLEGNREESGAFVLIGPGRIIFSKPDEKLFESDGLEAYKAELIKKLSEEEESRKHYEAYLKELRDNERLIQNFHYTETYFKEAKEKEKKYLEEISELKDRSEAIKGRRSEIKELKLTLEKEQEEKKRERDEVERKLRKLEAHLIKNEDYELHLHKEENLEKEQENLDRRLKGLKAEEDEITSMTENIQENIWRLDAEHTKVSKQKDLFANAKEKALEEGSIEELQAKYSKYQEKIDGNINRLEKDFSDRTNALRTKEKKLLGTGVSEEKYQSISYLESEMDRMIGVQEHLEKDVRRKAEVSKDAEVEAGRFSGVCETKREDLNFKGIALLPKADVHGKYKERSSECRASMKKMEELKKSLEKTFRCYTDIQGKIQERLRESKIKVSIKVWPMDRNVELGFKEVSEDLISLNKRLSEEKTDIQQNYWKLKEDYKEKHQHLSSILYTVEKMYDSAERDPDNYYYLFEYMENQLEVLNKLIRIQETRLEHMEKNFDDAVRQSYALAKEIYDHVNRVADDSSIQLDGKNRKVKMIEIILRELEPEEKGIDAMKLYIKECANDVKEQLKGGKTKKDVKDLISKFMSSEELLNVISDLSDLRIKAYKVDINAQNSKAKDWEKVMRENSGGERFVSFFAVMIALMSYARNSRKTTEDYNRKNKDSKVLLMDNPFGPISSDHLLKPLFDIAKKYNTQLICLTDLKQNSIMNQFKVIFMMKIVPNTSGTMEYLKVEESTYTGEEDSTEENLEMLHYHQEVEQMSLLDE